MWILCIQAIYFRNLTKTDWFLDAGMSQIFASQKNLIFVTSASFKRIVFQKNSRIVMVTTVHYVVIKFICGFFLRSLKFILNYTCKAYHIYHWIYGKTFNWNSNFWDHIQHFHLFCSKFSHWDQSVGSLG